MKVDREKPSNLETPDTVVANVQPARRKEQNIAKGSLDFPQTRRLKHICDSKSPSKDVPVESKPASDSSNVPANTSMEEAQAKVEYHENFLFD